VKVTLTDNEGCSTAVTYTGQTALCNGSAVATQTQSVQITDGIKPDTTPPETTIKMTTAVTRGPQHASQKRRVKFKFYADEPGATFECALGGPDGSKGPTPDFAPCKSPKRYRKLEPGKYAFRVRATDAAGNVDPTPAKFAFKLLD
jgi:hypothetical protein